jgi:hypothetical protein
MPSTEQIRQSVRFVADRSRFGPTTGLFGTMPDGNVTTPTVQAGDIVQSYNGIDDWHYLDTVREYNGEYWACIVRDNSRAYRIVREKFPNASTIRILNI